MERNGGGRTSVAHYVTFRTPKRAPDVKNRNLRMYRNSDDVVLVDGNTDVADPLPHGQIEEVFSNVFFVCGMMKANFHGVDYQYGRNMVIVREGEALTLINTVRLNDEGLQALDAFGRVENVVRLGGYHGRDDPFYIDKYEAKLWMFPSMPSTKGSARTNQLKPGSTPFSRCSVFQYESCEHVPEGLLVIDQDGGIVVSCDSIQNWATPDQYFDQASTEAFSKMNFFAPANIGPAWFKNSGVTLADVKRVLDLNFKHLLSAHGTPLKDDAYAQVSKTIAALEAKPTDSGIAPALAHGEIEEIFPNVFHVEGLMKATYDAEYNFGRNMTIVRRGKSLTLINTVRLDAKGLAVLDSLGSVDHVVRLGAAHGRDDAFYVNMYSSACYWALPDMAPVNGGATPTKMLSEDGATPFPDCTVLVYTTAKKPEAVLVIDQDGGILVSCDSWMNWAERDTYMDDASYESMKKMGFFAPASCSVWQNHEGCATSADIARVGALEFKHLVCGHGPPVKDNAKELIMSAIAALK